MKTANFQKMIARFLALALAFTLPAFNTPAKAAASSSAKSYYVSAAGSDAHAGSESAPWKHIQYALDRAAAGDTVYVINGTYDETVSFPKSGAKGAPITLQNYKNDKPLLSSEGKAKGTMVAVSGKNYIDIRGLEIAHEISKAYADDSKNDPDAVGIQVDEGSSHITIEGCTIHDIKAMDCEPGESQSEEDKYISRGNAHGIFILGNTTTAVTDVNVRNNLIYDMNTGYSETLTVDGNVDGWTVIGNTIHDVSNIAIDIAGHWETGCKVPELNQARNGIVAKNTVYGCTLPFQWCAGLYVDGAKNVLFEQNVVHDFEFGIEIGCEQVHDTYDENYGNPCTADNITARNNVLYNNHKCGIGIGGWNAAESGKVTNSKVLNNTLYNNDSTASGEGDFNIGWSDGLIIENNIIYGSGTEGLVLRNKVNPSTNLKMDYNIYASLKNAPLFQWEADENEPNSLNSLEEWRKASGCDLHSRFVDPKFTNTKAGNFTLQKDSPAVNAGNAASTLKDIGNVDFAGNSRVGGNTVDCGAFETGSGRSPVTPAEFMSDTNSNLSVNGAYTFKITSKNGKAPHFTVGTRGVFDVRFIRRVGNDYYYRITAIGAPGAQAGVYVNDSSRLLVATVKTK